MTEQSTEPRVPRWVTEPMQRFADDVDELDSLHRLCISGISALRAMPGVVKALVNSHDDTDPDNERRLRGARKAADLAYREFETDFPLLRALTAIALWSHLESNIRAFLTHCLQHEVPATAKILKKIKVSVGDWESLTREEKYDFLLERLEQEVSASLKPGVGRFEAVLEHCGLAGPVPDDLRRDILELSEVRNVLVHRNGMGDRRLAERCPWLKLPLGEKIRISEQMLQRYFAGAHRYVVLVFCRVAERHGVDVSDLNPTPPNPDSRQ